MASLQDIYDTLSDFIIDNTPGTVDVQSEGLRAINFLLNDMQSKHDWDFARKEYTLRYYKGVNDYAKPEDMKSLSSVYPASTLFDDFRMITPTLLKRYVRGGASENLVSLDRSITPGLKLHYYRTTAQKNQVEGNAAYDANGTWTGGVGVSNIRTDTQVYYTNNGSVAFDLASSSSFLLEKTLTEAVDLSQYIDGKLFEWVYFPTAEVTSFTHRWGTNSTNYYSSIATTQFDGNPFVTGWNLLSFDFENASTAGSPTSSSIVYLATVIVHTSSVTTKNWRFSELFASTYEDLLIRYYTNYNVYDVSEETYGTKFIGDDSNDLLIYPEEMVGVLQAGAAWLLLRQTLEPDEADRYRVSYESLLGRFIDKYPALIKKPEPSPMTMGVPFSYPYLRR